MSKAPSPPYSLQSCSSLLTVSRTCEILACSSKHVHRLLKAGLLRGVKVMSPESRRITKQSRWRVYAASVDAYLGFGKKTSKTRRDRPRLAAKAAAARAMLGISLPDVTVHREPERTPARSAGRHGAVA